MTVSNLAQDDHLVFSVNINTNKMNKIQLTRYINYAAIMLGKIIHILRIFWQRQEHLMTPCSIMHSELALRNTKGVTPICKQGPYDILYMTHTLTQFLLSAKF